MSTNPEAPQAPLPKWSLAFEAVMEHIREFHPDEIDDAYDYFWEEEDPEEFLSGLSLEIGFHNFEDWLVCDYRNKELDGKGFIERYMEATEVDEETVSILKVLDSSFLSLYEVASVEGDTVRLRDLALNKEVNLSEPRVCMLKPSEIFAARLVEVGGKLYMTHGVYPFSGRIKEKVVEYLGKLYSRYAKHNKDATMAAFLKSEAYSFNTIWVSCLHKIR